MFVPWIFFGRYHVFQLAVLLFFEQGLFLEMNYFVLTDITHIESERHTKMVLRIMIAMTVVKYPVSVAGVIAGLVSSRITCL